MHAQIDAAGAGPGLVAEVALEHLAVRVAGELVDQLDVGRDLVRVEPLGAPRPQLVRRGRAAHLDHGHRVLAVTVVGDAEHRAVDHVGVPVQHVLDLAGVHVHPGPDEHVAEPVGEVEVAVVVEVADVADA